MSQTRTADLMDIEGDLTSESEIGLILPTYCEVSNIQRLISDIENLNLDVRVLVIDDSSPDGTAKAVRELQKEYKNILLLIRPKKFGLGTAITDGFKALLSLKSPPSYIVTMDADYSHNPEDVPRAITAAKEGRGLAIGSRYCKGGGVVKWSIFRRLTSRVANILAFLVVRARIHDYTSGLRCYSTKLVQEMVPDLHSQTYEIQIETIRQACKRGFDVREFPMTFVNRKNGKSKLSANEIKEFTSYILRNKKPKVPAN
jgi:dolichol-phosphate mannosyltransferase